VSEGLLKMHSAFWPRNLNKRIQAKPENVDCIILSTCIPHNFIKKYNPSKFTCERTTTNTNGTTEHTRLENMPMQGGNATRDASRVRELMKITSVQRVGLFHGKKRE
jgi:hypothetical protein